MLFRSVLEFARRKWGLEQRQVALFASRDLFRLIGESREGTIFINAGYNVSDATPRMGELSRLQLDAVTPWHDARHDYVTVEMAFEYLKRYKPRVLYLSLDETDCWAHDKRYNRVLHMAQYFDRTLERLWQTLQSMDEYRDRTTLIVSSDHGRGGELADWFEHGRRVKGDRKSTRLNSSHIQKSRMPSSA